jgi:IclR family transcriptional regulator, mhp operon transcriptional activator
VNIQTQKLLHKSDFNGNLAHADMDAEQPNCRANSRRGQTDPSNRSYQPVESVRRALMILRAFDSQKISTISSLFEETGIPRPTIVRMLETLMYEGYVIRDNMCGGYRLTSEIDSLTAGYRGISRVIELARPMAIDLTRQVKWPIGLGTIDGDAITIQFWTGTISPWAYTNTTLGIRPDLLTTGMGRAYLAFCEPDELDRRIEGFRTDPELDFGTIQEHQLRIMLKKTRLDGYAMRDPQTPPYRISTIGIPLLENGKVQALISLSFFSSAVLRKEISEKIIQPLLETRSKIENALDFMNDGAGAGLAQDDGPEIEMSF